MSEFWAQIPAGSYRLKPQCLQCGEGFKASDKGTESITGRPPAQTHSSHMNQHFLIPCSIFTSKFLLTKDFSFERDCSFLNALVPGYRWEKNSAHDQDTFSSLCVEILSRCYYIHSLYFILLSITVNDSGVSWLVCWVAKKKKAFRATRIKYSVILVPKPIMCLESRLTLKRASMCSWQNVVAYGRQGLGNGGVVGHGSITECKVLVCPRHTDG